MRTGAKARRADIHGRGEVTSRLADPGGGLGVVACCLSGRDPTGRLGIFPR